MIGHPLVDVARTINFINDNTDYPDSVYTREADKFIHYYLEAYSEDEKLDLESLHKCLLINAYFEYSWAVTSNQQDTYSTRLETYINKNFIEYGSDRLIYLSINTNNNELFRDNF